MKSMLSYVNANTRYKSYSVVVSLIKVVALFLIFYSHADPLFPSKIRFLASGGAIGNELFFLMGGGVLFKLKENDRFISFCAKRFIRLYIPTYIMTIFLFVVNYIHLEDFGTVIEVFHLLLWPSQFWFVSAFFAISIAHYFLIKTRIFNSNKCFVIYSIFAWAGIVILYIIAVPDKSLWIIEDVKVFGSTVYFKCFYSFYVFSLGYFLNIKLQERERNDGPKRWVIGLPHFVLSLVGFYGFKMLLKKYSILMNIQIVSQPITVLVVASLYIWLEQNERLKIELDRHKIKMAIIMIGNITLESFLVQFQVIERINNLGLAFPVNYLIALFLVLFISIIFHFVNENITRGILCKLQG